MANKIIPIALFVLLSSATSNGQDNQDDIEKLRGKHPEIFGKLESEFAAEKQIGVSYMVKYSKLTNEEKKIVLLWTLKNSSLPKPVVINAIRGLALIKAKGKDVEETLQKLVSKEIGDAYDYLETGVVASAAIAISNLGFKDLKNDLIKCWKNDKLIYQRIAIFKSIVKLGLSEKDIELIIKNESFMTWIDMLQIEDIKHLKDYFVQVLEKEDPKIVAVASVCLGKLKAVECKAKMIELVTSSKASVEYSTGMKRVLGKLFLDVIAEVGSKEDAKELAPLLKHKEDILKGYSAITISKLGANDYEDDIAELMNDKSDSICLAAISSLTRLKSKKYLEKILKQLLERKFLNDILSYSLELNPAIDLAKAIKQMFTNEDAKELINVFKKIKDDVGTYNLPVKAELFNILVEWKVKDFVPVLMDELKSVKERLYLPDFIEKLGNGIAKIGSAEEYGSDVLKIMQYGKFPQKKTCLQILKKWKIKDGVDQALKLLEDRALAEEALEYLAEVDGITADHEETLKKFFKAWIESLKEQRNNDLVTFFNKFGKNKLAAEFFINVLVNVENLHVNKNYVHLPKNDCSQLLKLLSGDQRKKLEELVLKRVQDGQITLVTLLDYKTHEKEILKALVKFLNRFPSYTYLLSYINWLDPDVRENLDEKIKVISTEFDSDNVSNLDIVDALMELGYKFEFKCKKETIICKITLSRKYSEPFTVKTALTDFGKNYVLLEPGKKIIVFDDMAKVKEYLNERIKE